MDEVRNIRILVRDLMPLMHLNNATSDSYVSSSRQTYHLEQPVLEPAWNDSDLSSKFRHRLSEYDHTATWCRQKEYQVVFSFSLFGLLGALFSLIVFSYSSQFAKLDFLLYRAVGVLEIVHTTLTAVVRGVQTFDPLQTYNRSFAYQFVRAHVHLAIANTCAETVDMLVLFLSVERTVACLLPTHFRVLHKRRVYDTVGVLSFLFCLAVNLVPAFEVVLVYNNATGVYHFEESEFASTSAYCVYVRANMVKTCFLGTALIGVTFTSIVGLITAYRRKCKLRNRLECLNGRRDSVKSLIRLRRLSCVGDDLKKTVELCCLQLCLAVPIVVNYVMYTIALTNGIILGGTRTGEQIYQSMAERRWSLSFKDAETEVRLEAYKQYLRLFTNLSNILAHSCHFYCYLIFCTKIRKGVYDLLDSSREKFSRHPSRISGSVGNEDCELTPRLLMVENPVSDGKT